LGTERTRKQTARRQLPPGCCAKARLYLPSALSASNSSSVSIS